MASSSLATFLTFLTFLTFFTDLTYRTSPHALAFFEIMDELRDQLEKGETTESELEGLLDDLSQFAGAPLFRDIPSNAWFNRYVGAVAKWAIVSGYKDAQGNTTGTYGPADPVTVAEILKMALKAAKVDETKCKAKPRHPAANDHWAKLFVACGEARGLRLLGLRPDLNRPALRGEVLTIIHDAFQMKVPPLLSTFKDTIGHPNEADIAYAAARGVVSGDTDTSGKPLRTFRPNDKVNRAEAAKIIYEHLKSIVLMTGQ
jgi:hypothetical protein